jgi:DNA-binding LacI/PurR family transcriptional regulator
LITAASISMQVSALCDDRGIPVVMFNRYVPGFPANSVCCDNLGGGRLAASTLFAAGAKRYAMIYGDHSATTTIERMQGFTEFLAEQGVSDIAKSCGHYTYEGGYAAATALMASDHRPDALFCANDIMALGAIDAVRAAGRRVPDDLMIIGFDDIDEAARPPYRLTTIRQPIDQMVDAAMALLTGPSRESVAHRVPGRLIERATTRPRQTECDRIPS